MNIRDFARHLSELRTDDPTDRPRPLIKALRRTSRQIFSLQRHVAFASRIWFCLFIAEQVWRRLKSCLPPSPSSLAFWPSPALPLLSRWFFAICANAAGRYYWDVFHSVFENSSKSRWYSRDRPSLSLGHESRLGKEPSRHGNTWR